MFAKISTRSIIILQLLVLSSPFFSDRSLVGQPIESILSAENAALYYGATVAIDGGRAVVGSRCKVHVFSWSNSQWKQTYTLPNDAPCFERGSGSLTEFGTSVSLDGDRLAVGAPSSPVFFPGTVYLYQWDGIQWVETTKLNAPDSVRGDLFGLSVSLDGDRLVVGSPESYSAGARGAAYVFEWDGLNWLEVAKLTPDPLSPHRFGARVSLNGDRFVVAGVDTVSFQGVAYVFEWNDAQWSKRGELLASDGGYADAFGSSISVDQDHIVVGAPGLDPPIRPSATYVFELVGSEWSETAKLTLHDPTLQYFGASVVVNGETLMVGRTATCFVHGAVYVYRWDGILWVEATQIRTPPPFSVSASETL